MDKSGTIHIVEEEGYNTFLADAEKFPDVMIDCGENEEMFLALSALRDDSHYMQWFVWGKRWMLWKHDYNPHQTQSATGISSVFLRGHKATPKEIVEHFKTER